MRHLNDEPVGPKGPNQPASQRCRGHPQDWPVSENIFDSYWIIYLYSRDI